MKSYPRKQILNAVLAFVLLLLAVLLATGCKVPVDATGIDASKTATTTTNAPVVIKDIDGDVTVITQAGATPWTVWTIAGLVGLLWALRAKQQRTVTGALDRLILYLDLHHGAATREANCGDAETLKALKIGIKAAGMASGKPDRGERCIRDRLARRKK